jgi:hypothetical protein
MDNSNGTTQKISGRYENSGVEIKRIGLGETRYTSPGCGVNQIISGGENRIGGNFDWKLTPIRDTTAGKILERLESLETQTLSYIHSHQDQLEARLGEIKQLEEEFSRESNQIKSDIYHLAVAQQEKEIGDGTNKEVV